MYSRSRRCLNSGRIDRLVNSQSRQHVPLDFLYPRWFTQSSKSLVPAGADADAYACRVDSAGDVDQAQDLQNIPLTKGKGEPVTWKDHATCQPLMRSARLESSTRSAEAELWELETAVGKPKEPAQVTKRRLQNRAVRDPELWEAETPLQCGTALRLRRLEGQLSPNLPAQKTLKRLVMKAKHERDIIWTVPARILSKAMQSPHRRDVERILVHKRTILHLTGTTCENTWRTFRGDCQIHVLARAKGCTGQREVLLYGSCAARDSAKQSLRLEDELLTGLPGRDGEHLEENIRWFPCNPHYDTDAQDASWADQIQAPDEWSVKAFAKYVESLCTLRLTRGLQRDLFPGGVTFHHNLAVVLEEVFTREELTPYLSSHAFSFALQFACKHSELGSTRELLYSRAKQLGLHRQTSIFNIMVEEALKRKEIRRLEGLVEDMQNASIVPDGITWSKLLLVSPTAFARRHILDFIVRVYPDDHATVLKHLEEKLVERELVQVTKKPNGLQVFLQRMDNNFGPDWLTSRTLVKVLRTCADYQLWQAADEMLDLATERRLEMLPSTVTTLMYLHYLRGNLNAAIDLLQSSRTLKPAYDSASVVHWAFLLAWRQQRYNVCRVLWQYAATRGLISHQMQNHVYVSLIRNQHMAALPEQQSWEDHAGKLVIGTNLKSTDFDTQFPLLSRYFSTTRDPLQWLGQWVPNNGTRKEQISLAYAMMHRDLTAWKTLKAMSRHDLRALLNAARRKDQAWVAERFTSHATLAEMLASAIQVPLLPAVEQHRGSRSHRNVGPLSSQARTRVNAPTQISWKHLHLPVPSVSSKMAALTLALRCLSPGLGSVRTMVAEALVPWLQMCRPGPCLSTLSLLLKQCLLGQRGDTGVQSPHPGC